MKIFWENFVIFDQVRLKPYFIRVWWDFGVKLGDFWWCWNGEKHWFFKVLSNSVSNSKWGLRRGWNRCAWFCNRTFVLKCKLCPHPYRTDVLEYAIIVQYYCMFFYFQVKILYTYFCQVKILDMFSTV